MDCRVYSPTYINLCPWAIKWTGFGFGVVNGHVAQYPTLGLSFGWLERFSDRPRMNLGLVCFRNRCFRKLSYTLKMCLRWVLCHVYG